MDIYCVENLIKGGESFQNFFVKTHTVWDYPRLHTCMNRYGFITLKCERKTYFKVRSERKNQTV